jgi:polysaccharide biosynthesis protein PelB
MLQDRSKRIAASDGRIARLILVTDRELAGVVVALLILLLLVFPNKQLFEELLSRSPDDALSIAYLENLLHSDPENMDWRLLLAGAQTEHIPFSQLETLLQPVWQQGSEAQQHRARQIRLQGIAIAYQRGTIVLPETEIDTLLQRELNDSNSLTELIRLADNTILLNRNKMTLGVYQRMAQAFPDTYRKYLLKAAERSIGIGKYRLAADLYFLARQNASLQQARRFFRLGISALMADNRYKEALQYAERHLGALKRDAETLRFLIRISRAADSSSRAAQYARMLLELEKPL